MLKVFRCPENTVKPWRVRHNLSWKTIKFKQETQLQSFNIMQEFKKVFFFFFFWLVSKIMDNIYTII